jgi:hypothetical protein
MLLSQRPQSLDVESNINHTHKVHTQLLPTISCTTPMLLLLLLLLLLLTRTTTHMHCASDR